MKILVTSSAVVLGTLLLFPGSALFAQNKAALTQHEQAFLRDMAQGNIAEMELGQLAQEKGTTAAIRDFGTRMVQDHTALNNQLKRVAADAQANLPTTISAQQQQEKKKLEGLSGESFDKTYMDIMLTDHQGDIKNVQQEAENAQNVQVKRLAEKTLPILEDHLRIAENDAGRLGVSAHKGLNEPEHPGEQAQR